MGKKKAASEAKAPSFEESLQKLEQIVHELEDGQLGLNDSLARYEDGVKCLKQCYLALEQAERKIEQLAGVDADGRPVTTPFEDGQTSLADQTATRARRRGHTEKPDAKSDPDMDEKNRLF